MMRLSWFKKVVSSKSVRSWSYLYLLLIAMLYENKHLG